MPVEYSVIQGDFLEIPNSLYMLQAMSLSILIGEIVIQVTGDSSAHLSRLYVNPEWRGFKIGRELLHRGESWTRSKKIYTISGAIGDEFNHDMSPEEVRARLEHSGYIFEGGRFEKYLK